METTLSLLGPQPIVTMPVVGHVLAGTTGFQSPADDYLDERIDLAKELITSRPNTFCWRVNGASFEKAGIADGAIVVIDYSETPKPGNIVLVRIGDVATLKIIRFIHGKPYLTSASDGYPTIPINEEEGVRVYGVLKHCWVSF